MASVAYYGERLVWRSGFDGNWAKSWQPVSDDDRKLLSELDFQPSGPKPEEQIEEEVLRAITEIHEDTDDFEPMGEDK